ncbi:MAG: acyl-CoA carboxylase subunit beta [Proteobacteria bacterium]|nr:acyl-CoA carboxylase subunit beta [Pseudomonadota bacterium]
MITPAASDDNRAAHITLIDEMRMLEQRVRDSSNRSRAKFEKRGQLVPRDRLKLLLDRGAPFVELSTLCGYKMHDDDGDKNIAGGGVIGGIGFVSGVRVMIGASDSGIRGGAATPMGVEKVLRAQDIAFENKLPYVQIIESAGANLFRQADMFVKGGKTFANLARHSAAGLPVVSLVSGSSTAGGAYQSGLSDYIVVVRNRSRIFLAGPPLLRAATGEIASEEELGGAEMHYHVSGTAEYMAENDADGIRQVREIVGRLGWNREFALPPLAPAVPPAGDPDAILDVVPSDYRKPYDVRAVIAHLVDASQFLDFKAGYGPDMVTVHARIGGHEVGILSNNGPIDANCAAKAAQFIQLCCQSNIPIIYLQNTTGYMVGTESERGGIVKHGSKMIQAVANATVPQITIVIGGSFGAGNYGMCGRAYDPRFIFAWPNSRTAVMGGEQAAGVMKTVTEQKFLREGKPAPTEQIDKMFKAIVDQFDRESTALYATAHLWDDGIIDPRDTRRILAFTLSIARESMVRPLNPITFGVARM